MSPCTFYHFVSSLLFQYILCYQSKKEKIEEMIHLFGRENRMVGGGTIHVYSGLVCVGDSIKEDTLSLLYGF